MSQDYRNCRLICANYDLNRFGHLSNSDPRLDPSYSVRREPRRDRLPSQLPPQTDPLGRYVWQQRDRSGSLLFIVGLTNQIRR